jgi:hypothetical protein
MFILDESVEGWCAKVCKEYGLVEESIAVVLARLLRKPHRWCDVPGRF